MIKLSFKGPSERDLTKMLMAAAEKKITDKVQKASSPFGGVTISFHHKPDGSINSVEFHGSEEAVCAARDALAA